MQRLRAQNKIHRVKCSVCEIIKHYFLPTKTFTRELDDEKCYVNVATHIGHANFLICFTYGFNTKVS